MLIWASYLARRTKGAASLLVAASNAPAAVKLVADYICDGTADQVEINAAIAALQTGKGGIVHLSAGQFLVNAPIQINVGETIILEGEGIAHYTDLATEIKLASGSNCHVIQIASSGGIYHIFRDFCVHGNCTYNTSGSGIYNVSGVGDMTFYNLAIVQCPEYGIRSGGTNNHFFNCWFEHNTNSGLFLYGATRPIVYGCFFSDNEFGVRAEGTSKAIVVANNVIWDSTKVGIYVRYVTHGIIANNIVIDSSQYATNNYANIDIETNSYYINVYGNTCGTDDATYAPKCGIHLDALADYCTIYGNNLEGSVTAEMIVDSGANANGGFVRGNFGFKTENSGTATLANGTTSIAVNHGLDVTPSAGDIVVTPIETWGNMTQFYIDTYTSTQFTIHADQNPGQDVDFAWSAAVY